MYRIRKRFKFEMAHMLTTCYSTECRNIHGHSYVMDVIVQSPELNDDGMIIDFKLLKKVVNKHIIDPIDHALVVDRSISSSPLCEALEASGTKLVKVKYNPTAENMVKEFHAIIWEGLKPGICPHMTDLEIILHETDTGWASYKN